MAILYATLLTCFLIVAQIWAEREASPEKFLIDSLLRNYSPKARPVRSHNHTVHVYIGFAYIAVIGVDEHGQSMKSIGTVKIEWVDPFLSWNTSVYSDIEAVFLPVDSIWTPDIMNVNSIGSMMEPIRTEGMVLKLYHNGSVTWMPSGMFQSYCDVDITLFPFDKQNCTLAIGSNAYDAENVEISVTDEPRSSFADADDKILGNSQWKVLGESSTLVTSPNRVRRMSMFTVHIQRRSRYFIMNIVFPSFVLSLLNIFVFLVPHDKSDKVGVTTTLVLAYTIFLIQVTDSAPTNSDQIPFVTAILLVMMSLSALDVIISILMLQWINSEKTHPPPIWLLRLTKRQQRKYKPNHVEQSSYAEKETTDEKTNSERNMSQQEIWRKQWDSIGQTIDKGIMTTQALIVFSLYTLISCIYLWQTYM